MIFHIFFITLQLQLKVSDNHLPKSLGYFNSGASIPSVSQERIEFKSSNFTVSLLFVTLTTCQKIGFPEQAVGRFTNGFSGPESFRDFRETGPRPEGRDQEM